MALPINISELINGKTVEWERIEFRKGWNPERTLKTITAFANDFNNWGGGYIILGIEEKDGASVLPPTGIKIGQIDAIQKELNQLCRKIIPNYFPIVEPVEFQDKTLLILWCPGGSTRPYKCPVSLGNKPHYFYYIRKFSSTVKPTNEEEQEIISMANKVPFDDRVNHFYKVDDFDLSAIKIFLNKVGSELEKDIPKLPIDEIARKMNIAEGSDEYLLPKNVGLLFFAKEPQKVFPSAIIEIVTFNDEAGTSFTEQIFSGNLYEQLTNALSFLKNQVVTERIIKIENQAEAERFYNYPYRALEEALCNAVYHRGYDNDSTIEVRIYPTRIDIINFPGPLPPLNKEDLENNIFDVRKYRNRRIGEFLKELELTEGRGTGIPTIIRELKKNNSPAVIFKTDADRYYFKTSFNIHQKFIQSKSETIVQHQHQVGTKLALSWHQVGTKLGLSREQVEKILKKCMKSTSIKEIMQDFVWSDRTKFRSKFINPFLDLEFLQMSLPDKPNSPNQKYIITHKGKLLIATTDKLQKETENIIKQNNNSTKLALSWHQVGTKLGLSREQVEKILNKCMKSASIKEIMQDFDRSDRTKFRSKFINPFLDLEFLQMSLPDKPNSPNQKYVTTEKGRELLTILK